MSNQTPGVSHSSLKLHFITFSYEILFNFLLFQEDFPLLCETCLGPNPYVRMTKLPDKNKLCKISNLPFPAFRWKAGPNGRHKETIISYVVAADKNICQCCLNDLRYGLPVGVRDALLQKAENTIATPTSIVGLQYHYQQQQRELAVTGYQPPEETTNMSLQIANAVPSKQLDRLSASLYAANVQNPSKTAFRNLPKLCSFWLNGACTRVGRRTCPFRPCCCTFVFPEIAGSHKEICTELVKKLEADGPDSVQRNMPADWRHAIQQSLKGNREENIKKRVMGEDDLTKKYLGKVQSMVSK
jgi:hypothetical protein